MDTLRRHPRHRSRLRRGTLALLGFALVAASPAVAVPAAWTEVAREAVAPSVAAHEGISAWNRYDALHDRYSLVVRDADGTIRIAPIAPRVGPFDVDLGTNRTGSVYAVYTRCSVPRGTGRVPGYPGPAQHGCDVYRMSVATGREEHLTQISSPSWDERDPTIHRGTIGFVRAEQGRDGLVETIRTGTTASGAPPTRVRARVVTRTRTRVTRRGLYGPQLGPHRLSYVALEPSDFSRRSVHVRDLAGAGRDRVVYTATSGGANAADVTEPTFSLDGGTIYFARTNTGSGVGNRLIRYRIGSKRFAYEASTAHVQSSAWMAPNGFVVGLSAYEDQCDFGGRPATLTCPVLVTGPVDFADRP